MLFDVPEELRYLPTHEWVRLDDGDATVGVTDFAQDELGDVVFLDLPAPGESFGQGDQFGVIESMKATSDLFLPVGGEITAVNDRLEAEPELVNRDPYGDGWMVQVAVAEPAAPDALRSAAEYVELTE